MVRPSWVRLSSRANGAPLSTASTSPRQASSVAGGKAAAGVGFCGTVIVAMCHAGHRRRTSPAVQLACHALAPWQLLDARNIHALKRVVHRYACDDAVGCDLGQRHENERALEQTRVGQRQGRVVEDKIVVSQDVEIDGT